MSLLTLYHSCSRLLCCHKFVDKVGVLFSIIPQIFLPLGS
nr:MAG TPA: hypothetical protein [Bacteriophage sp.]